MDFKELVEKGQDIYEHKLKKQLEKKRPGEFVAIDVDSENYYLGITADEAVKLAKEANSDGLFHLIRIGHSGVYRMGSLSSNADYPFL